MPQFKSKKWNWNRENPSDRGIKLNWNCNNNCVFCYDAMRRKELPILSLEEAKLIVMDFKKKEVKTIALQGSEPTIYPFIYELISFIDAQGMDFKMTTNARLFYYEDIVKKFVKSGLKHVYTSLHSHKAEVHDQLTRTQGSFRQAVQGIKNLLKYRVTVETNTTITKQNVYDLENIALFLSDEFKSLLRVRFSSLYHIGTICNDWEKIMPKFSIVKPNLIKAMKILRAKNIYSFLEKTPICIAPEFYPDFRQEGYVDEAFIKPNVCYSCKFYKDTSCVGINPKYLELYGEEGIELIN